MNCIPYIIKWPTNLLKKYTFVYLSHSAPQPKYSSGLFFVNWPCINMHINIISWRIASRQLFWLAILMTPACLAETPLDCEVSMWSSWGLCMRPCSRGGLRHRTRYILLKPANSGTPCPELEEQEECTPHNCLTYQWCRSHRWHRHFDAVQAESRV